MRVKQLWINFSFLGQLRLAWDRITVSRLTIGYVIFSICHCLLQTAFQTRVFVLNTEARQFLHGILEQTNAARPDAFPVIRDDVQLCTSDETENDCFIVWNGSPQVNYMGSPNQSVSRLSGGNSSSTAGTQSSSATQQTAASTTKAAAQTQQSATSISSTAAQTSSSTTASSQTNQSPSSTAAGGQTSAQASAAPSAGPADDAADDDLFEDDEESDGESDDEDDVDSASSGDESSDDEAAPARREVKSFINGLLKQRSSDQNGKTLASVVDGYYSVSLPDGEAQLTEACVNSLNYPVFALERTEREDAAFILFNFWVLGMSIVAVLNESIPHILASLLTHILATSWAGFQIYHTNHFKADYHYAIADGACSGIPGFLTDYWGTRARSEYPALALNILALGGSVVLTWYLMKTFGWKTFKRIGASVAINRLYKLVLVFSIAIQLSLFFIFTTVGIWVDQLCNGAPRFLADHKAVYIAISIITILLVGPWVFLGWTGARREKRLRMGVFLGLSLLYVVAWTLQFLSHTFRWQFNSWPFARVMTVVALLLTAITVILGVIVRVNFGKGLVNYLARGSDLNEPRFEPYYIRHNDEEARNNDREKVQFPTGRASLQQYPDNDSPYPEVAIPPTARKKPITRKIVPAIPQALKGVPRYQGLFKSKSNTSSDRRSSRPLSTEIVSSPTSGLRPLTLAGQFHGLSGHKREEYEEPVYENYWRYNEEMGYAASDSGSDSDSSWKGRR